MTVMFPNVGGAGELSIAERAISHAIELGISELRLNFARDQFEFPAIFFYRKAGDGAREGRL